MLARLALVSDVTIIPALLKLLELARKQAAILVDG
jgi:hypothetical protein